MCKIEQSIHNCLKCANRPKRSDPGDQADQANWLLLVLQILHLKVHYNVLGTCVHILLHLFVTAKDTFTFIYVFILIQKVKGQTC